MQGNKNRLNKKLEIPPYIKNDKVLFCCYYNSLHYIHSLIFKQTLIFAISIVVMTEDAKVMWKH